MTPDEAANVVDFVSETWGAEFSPARAAVYISELSDLPFGETLAAVKGLVRTFNVVPSIARIRSTVMGAAGLLPPDPQTAIAQADRWLRYQDQLSYANGSGYRPVEPEVHPAVVRACALVNGGYEGWRRDFLAAYDSAAASTTEGILSVDYGHAVAALGDGS